MENIVGVLIVDKRWEIFRELNVKAGANIFTVLIALKYGKIVSKDVHSVSFMKERKENKTKENNLPLRNQGYPLPFVLLNNLKKNVFEKKRKKLRLKKLPKNREKSTHRSRTYLKKVMLKKVTARVRRKRRKRSLTVELEVVPVGPTVTLRHKRRRRTTDIR